MNLRFRPITRSISETVQESRGYTTSIVTGNPLTGNRVLSIELCMLN